MARSDLVARLRALFTERSAGVVCAYLFGSFARAEESAGSDVDLAVLFAAQPPATLEDGLGLGLAGAIEDAIGRPVDLVVLNGAPVDLVHRVLRDGILLWDADPSARIRFEVAARNAYFDLLPILRRYRRAAPVPAGAHAGTPAPQRRKGAGSPQ